MRALFRLPIAGLLVFALAACVTVPKHEVSQVDVRAMRLEATKVSFAPEAKIDWPQADEVMAKEEKAGTPPPGDHLGSFQSYAEHRLAAALDHEARQSLSRLMQGQRPVRLEITVTRLHIPGVAARTAQVVATIAVSAVLFGPAAGAVAGNVKGISMTGSATLVDARTGTALAALPSVTASAESTQLYREPVDGVAKAYVIQVYRWLSQDGFADALVATNGPKS